MIDRCNDSNSSNRDNISMKLQYSIVQQFFIVVVVVMDSSGNSNRQK